MKIKRLISLVLIVVMCIAVLPANVFAWSSMSHTNSADIILMELQRIQNRRRDRRAGLAIHILGEEDPSKKVHSYLIPEEFQDAIMSYPDAFRAGSLGPDFYPDIIAGQMITHPYDSVTKTGSGEWVKLLCDSINYLPKDSEERKEALSFALGYMLHFCGDLFGHDFINSFSGGTYPDVTDVNYLNERDVKLNNVMSHMSQETYMDSLVNKNFYRANDYLGIDAPTNFITNTMIAKGNVENGRAALYDKYSALPPHFEWLIDWRTELYLESNEWRDNPDPTISAMATAYLDRWVEDQDKAIYALTETFDNIARRMVTDINPSTVDIVTEEMKAWGKNYGKYITGIPDTMIDGVEISIEVLDMIFDALDFDLDFLPDLDELIEEWIEDILLEWIGFPDIDKTLARYEARLKNPQIQLDHDYNPFKPAEENFEEFKQYMDRYAEEQRLLSTVTATDILNDEDNGVLDEVIDSDFEAFYNTMVMFKLILIGTKNYTDLVGKLTDKKQSAVVPQTAYVSATGLEFEITTASFVNSGTDDDIYATIYKIEDSGKRTQIAKKLLDKSGHNDFEIGSNDKYFVELPEAVRVDRIEIAIEQEGNITAGGFWKCENIRITPMHAGVALTEPIGVGGNNHMDSGRTWYLNFQNALNARDHENPKTQLVTTLKVQIRTGKAGTTPGTNSNIYLEAYDGSDDAVWESVLLDKYDYDDFESGDNDTYIVPVAKYNYSSGETEAIPLDQLQFGIRNSGSDDWLISDMWVTPYNGELQLAETAYIGDDTTLSNSTRRHSLKSLYADSDYMEYDSIPRSYETALDDSLVGLIKYVKSIDAGQQWADNSNKLWRDPLMRSNVFFKIFKGFSPEIQYSGTGNIEWNEDVAMRVSLSGIWNGVGQARRDKVSDFTAMPSVSGKVTVSFINSGGTTVCSTRPLTVEGNEVALRRFNNGALVPGSYDVKVTYTADVNNPMYSDGEKIFANALVINEPENINRTVDSVEVFDIDVPIAGKNPDYQATVGDSSRYEFANYGAEKTGYWWYDSEGSPLFAEDTFKAGETYTLEIKLNTKSYAGSLTNFSSPITAYLNGTAVDSGNIMSSSSVVYIYAEYVCRPQNSIVDTVKVLDIDEPFAGESPDYQATLGEPDNYEFAKYGPDGVGYWWYDSEGVPMFSDDKFVLGETYTLEIKLSQKKVNNLILSTFNSPVTAYLNGQIVPSENISSSSQLVYIYAEYVCGFRNSLVDMVEILDIDTPVDGRKPDYYASLGDSDRYEFANYGAARTGYWWCDSEGVPMSVDDRFVAGETYTLEIKISQKKIGNRIMTTFKSPVKAYLNGEAIPSEDVMANSTTTYVYATYVCEENPLSVSGTVSSGEISVEVKKFVDTGVLVVAQYNGARMEGVQMIPIDADGVYTMDKLTHKSGSTYKAFLWSGSTLEMLCKATEFK